MTDRIEKLRIGAEIQMSWKEQFLKRKRKGEMEGEEKIEMIISQSKWEKKR